MPESFDLVDEIDDGPPVARLSELRRRRPPATRGSAKVEPRTGGTPPWLRHDSVTRGPGPEAGAETRTGTTTSHVEVLLGEFHNQIEDIERLEEFLDQSGFSDDFRHGLMAFVGTQSFETLLREVLTEPFSRRCAAVTASPDELRAWCQWVSPGTNGTPSKPDHELAEQRLGTELAKESRRGKSHLPGTRWWAKLAVVLRSAVEEILDHDCELRRVVAELGSEERKLRGEFATVIGNWTNNPDRLTFGMLVKLVTLLQTLGRERVPEPVVGILGETPAVYELLFEIDLKTLSGLKQTRDGVTHATTTLPPDEFGALMAALISEGSFAKCALRPETVQELTVGLGYDRGLLLHLLAALDRDSRPESGSELARTEELATSRLPPLPSDPKKSR